MFLQLNDDLIFLNLHILNHVLKIIFFLLLFYVVIYYFNFYQMKQTINIIKLLNFKILILVIQQLMLIHLHYDPIQFYDMLKNQLFYQLVQLDINQEMLYLLDYSLMKVIQLQKQLNLSFHLNLIHFFYLMKILFLVFHFIFYNLDLYILMNVLI